MHKASARAIEKVWIVPVILLAFCTACATQPAPRDEYGGQVTAGDVLGSSPLAAYPGGEGAPRADILEFSPEMSNFLDENVDRRASKSGRLSQLILAVVGENRFLLAYDDSTRTARETFESRRGNCLSFTSLFVAMARDLGLRANFQEVDIPPDWSMAGEAFLLSQHVNAVVEMRNDVSRVVDFNIDSYDGYKKNQWISDERAHAHYYNNIGVEHMLAGEAGRAYANFRQSLAEDESFVSAWVNLGILHRREGLADYAETAWLEALDLDASNLMAMSNLADLYGEQGRLEVAESYLEVVRTHRMKNPYYRYQLASLEFDEGNFETSMSHLKYAIRKRREEHRFYHLMSLNYLMLGDRQESQRWMEKAEDMARRGKDKQRYHHKLELLMGQGEPFAAGSQDLKAASTGVE